MATARVRFTPLFICLRAKAWRREITWHNNQVGHGAERNNSWDNREKPAFHSDPWMLHALDRVIIQSVMVCVTGGINKVYNCMVNNPNKAKRFDKFCEFQPFFLLICVDLFYCCSSLHLLV